MLATGKLAQCKKPTSSDFTSSKFELLANKVPFLLEGSKLATCKHERKRSAFERVIFFLS